ncbi:MAG: tRNA (adenosine(37)-N6)-threonylcarbamoyltransferase complex ATPase subunit type 1 TsaE [Pyrinomonadaceae bacterium]
MLTLPETSVSTSPEETFDVGRLIGEGLSVGDAVLLTGGLGAGKTLLTRGIVDALGFDIEEVTSPSFTLVNLYRTDSFDIYHIDLWRIDKTSDVAFAVGLDEIADNEKNIVIIEWANQLGGFDFHGNVFRVSIEGDGNDPRTITIDIENAREAG